MSVLAILGWFALIVFGLILLAAIAWAALLAWVLRVESYDEPDDIDEEPAVEPDDWDEYGDAGGSPRP